MPATATSATQQQQKRAFWLRHLHQWHWISSAICLVAMCLFAFTGITLNHAGQIEAQAKVSRKKLSLPTAISQHLQAQKQGPLPDDVRQWLQQQNLPSSSNPAEWSEEEVYLALPRPGGDAWLRFDLLEQQVEFEKTERGAIAYLNDLHKGRNTGAAWSWFIDIFAAACLIFSLTGLLLIKMHARQRRLSWPLVAGGLVIPLVLALLFIHS